MYSLLTSPPCLHLSPRPTQNLRKFMLIVDVTFAEESARLISSTLGWVHVARLSQKRKALGGKNPFGVMRRSTAELLAQLDSAVLDRMKRHLRHELELYGRWRCSASMPF